MRRYPDIRRVKSLGATGEFHSQPGMNEAACPNKAFILLSHTTAFMGDPYIVLIVLYAVCCVTRKTKPPGKIFGPLLLSRTWVAKHAVKNVALEMYRRLLSIHAWLGVCALPVV